MVGREMRPTAGGEAVTETIILIQVLKLISQEPKNDSCSTVLHHHRHAFTLVLCLKSCIVVAINNQFNMCMSTNIHTVKCLLIYEDFCVLRVVCTGYSGDASLRDLRGETEGVWTSLSL